MKSGKTNKGFKFGFGVGGVNTELTLSTGAAGLVEKPKRSFTEVLEGFCTKGLKKKKKICVYLHLMQVWTDMWKK